jgi:hypothetical protein
MPINWDIIIYNSKIEINLENRQYHIPWVSHDLGCIACKITISGGDESIKEYLEILKKGFKTAPINFSNWKKLEKKFDVKKSDVLAAWNTALNS